MHDEYKELDRTNWLMLVASLAGPMRESVTIQRPLPIPLVNSPVLLASNAQTPVLFVSVRTPLPGAGQQIALIGRSANLSAQTSVAVDLNLAPFRYDILLLEGEQVYIQLAQPLPGTVIVTEAAFR